jgi:hypothetical protein
MIIVQPAGGIGNQTFQYVAGRAPTLRLGSELLDQSSLGDVAGHSCALARLPVNAQ